MSLCIVGFRLLALKPGSPYPCWLLGLQAYQFFRQTLYALSFMVNPLMPQNLASPWGPGQCAVAWLTNKGSLSFI